MYKHFLITRFNLRHKDWQKTRKGDLVLTDEWLSDRFDIFKMWCYPSVRNQKEQNFTWLVYFDVLTPDSYRNIIEDLARRFNNFTPCFVDGHAEFYESILKDIDANTGPEHSHIITSRLDNDDALHCRYTEVVQSAYRKQDLGVIDIVNGYQLAFGTSPVEIRKVRDQSNPFISLVEVNHDPKTVLSKMHRGWGDCSDRTIIENEEAWLQVIHGKNLVNCILQESPYTNKIELCDFGKNDQDIELMTSSQVFFSNIKRVVVLLAKRIIRSVLVLLVRLRACISNVSTH